MGIVSGFGRWMKGNFEMGRHITDMLTRNMEPTKARRVGGAIDAIGGAAITGFMGLQTLGNIAAVSTAMIGLVTLSAPILPALATIAIGTAFGAMGALCTSMGVGLLSAAKEKFHIPGPKAAVVGVGHAVGHAGHGIASAAKWTGRHLRHPFKKAHDGSGPAAGTGAGPDNRPKPGHHSF